MVQVGCRGVGFQVIDDVLEATGGIVVCGWVYYVYNTAIFVVALVKCDTFDARGGESLAKGDVYAVWEGENCVDVREVFDKDISLCLEELLMLHECRNLAFK